MQLEQGVTFVIKYVEPSDYDTEQISNLDIERLKNYIACQGIGSKVAYSLNVSRYVYYMADFNILVPKSNQKPEDNYGIKTDDITFIVADKLTYYGDLKKYLKENHAGYDKKIEFRHFENFEQNKPIFFTGNREYNGSFLPYNHDGILMCRPLTEQDIVVNKDLHQIWPIQTNTPPVLLSAILNKQIEKIN